jgi:leucyl/phenylalanyl-tRNA--protein transferase
MPIYALNKEPIFPDPNLADESGLLAVGGDLSVDRLVQAYSNGIFPWYSQGEPILWWSPDPRMVLFPENFKISKSLKQTLKNKSFEVKFDTNFREVIKRCAEVPRRGQPGTWITKEMSNAYQNLFKEGIAHSVETYQNGNLVGGLYGLSLGAVFFGESMFQTERDASKVALYHLVKKVTQWNFLMIDAQVETDHMKSLGAINIERKEFLMILEKALNHPTIKGKW